LDPQRTTILLPSKSLTHDPFLFSLRIPQETLLNEIPAHRGTTPTDSFTDSIVLSGSIAVCSALRATGKDQQEDQKKGYLLSTLMSSFDNPSLQDGRNKGILPSDEVISVADEKDGHSVSLLFLSFFQSRKI
jgi:hypothetical protein